MIYIRSRWARMSIEISPAMGGEVGMGTETRIHKRVRVWSNHPPHPPHPIVITMNNLISSSELEELEKLIITYLIQKISRLGT